MLKLKSTLTAGMLAVGSLAFAWSPAGDHISSPWADKVDPANPLPEYPRPVMERQNWVNLNGLWDYSILPTGDPAPQSYQGEILVPFAVESSLSGVGKTVGKANNLWYHREFTVPSSWKGQNVMLNFGAVDYKADVYVNDIKVAEHIGGFVPFSVDITPYLKQGKQSLVVKVWDPTDAGYQGIGKQISKPNGIWYTPVTGIWQTVWMEPVAANHIEAVNTVPDIDNGTLTVDVPLSAPAAGSVIEVIALDGGKTVATAKTTPAFPAVLSIADAKLWSPDSPFLYDMEVNLYENGKKIDSVKSYAAMRKISTRRDENGVMRMQLNNKDLFQYGPLDQGYWPDGLYTAPTDEALLYDIKKTKDWGFNMIRKHMKVEPARWYTHCDREGILVWQDMPRINKGPKWVTFRWFDDTPWYPSEAAEANFRHEWKEIMDFCRPYPSIVVWTPFNEAWGQFKTKEISDWTKAYDPSRLVNSSSGGNHIPGAGEIVDIHHYPNPTLSFYDGNNVTVLGEFGGLGLPLEGHLWQNDKNWGYVKYENAGQLTDEYVKLIDEFMPLVKRGYSAGVYTQTTDVEGEVNGIMTYDRKVMKMDEKRLHDANQRLVHSLDNNK